MPELPDIEVYREALARRVCGRLLTGVRVRSPFLVRTFDPPLDSMVGGTIRSVERLGKRLILETDRGRWLVIHLMIAGRLLWKPVGTKLAGKIDLAAFEFENGVLFMTEASTMKRASVHLFATRDGLMRECDRGGIEPLACSPEQFRAALMAESRTLKRILTDPRRYSGIGNAYSDEILHAAKLSPVQRSGNLNDAEVHRLYEVTQRVLTHWTAALMREFDLTGNGEGRFPKAGEITAFRPDFCVHGKFGQPCPVCGSKVQRIVRAENETNYCPGCQTGGRLLADRSLSRLLGDDWGKELDL